MAREGRRLSPYNMKAIVQDEYGSADVLRLEDVETPVAGRGEVLIRVIAASAFIGDWHVITGTPYAIRLVSGLGKPKQRVRGQDVAGVIEAVGGEVTAFRLGDEVFGVGNGTFAEYATARPDRIAPKPVNLGFEEAATVPTTGCTALQGIRDVGKVRSGQSVLVIGAAGGVGSFAVQIAKAFGAHVTAVCSTSKVELVRSIGADEVIEGETESEPRGLVLRLRRVALGTGVVRRAYLVRAQNVYDLIDSATAAIARDFRLPSGRGGISDVRTASPAAYLLYEEGLRAYYQFDVNAAYRLMVAALQRDSSFAMAAYWVWQLVQASRRTLRRSLRGELSGETRSAGSIGTPSGRLDPAPIFGSTENQLSNQLIGFAQLEPAGQHHRCTALAEACTWHCCRTAGGRGACVLSEPFRG